jgi:D-serine deaminase-like pyridoxal phosphate-dependent protein
MIASLPSHSLSNLGTPAAIVDLARMDANIARMQSKIDSLGVHFRPHVKTAKSLPVVERQLAAGARGITVSTLKEAEQFFAAGITDILYAVGIAPNKFQAALELRRRGCDLKLLTDSPDIARALAAFGREHRHWFDLLIEIDSDGHRAGIKPDSPVLLELAAGLAAQGDARAAGGARLAGVMTHAGASYELDDPQALARMAEQERSRCVAAAQRLREAGHACAIVSVGSTPTALSAAALDGVTEVRAGVYVFFDLVMANVGVCSLDDIAMSVLTAVIGHQPEKGWALVDAGWMAMSRDRGTGSQRHDYGYGQVCDVDGHPIAGLTMCGANQEHGIVAFDGTARSGVAAGTVPAAAVAANVAADVADAADIVKRLPVGTLLRILPNHACATAAQFDRYQVLAASGERLEWPRFGGW